MAKTDPMSPSHELIRITEHVELSTLPETKEVSDTPNLTFQMNEEEIKTSDKSEVVRIKDINPFPDQTPKKILERETRVTHGTSFSSGFDCVYCPFFDQSIRCPESFKRAASCYKYIRFKKVVWRVMFTGSPFLYGAFFLTTAPFTRFRSNAEIGVAAQDRGWASCDDTVMVDVSTQQEIELEVEWPFPYSWVLTSAVYDSYSSELEGYESLRLLSLKIATYQGIAALDSSMSNAVNAKIYCRLEGVEIACPQAPAVYSDETIQNRRAKIGISQGDNIVLPPAWAPEARPSPIMAGIVGSAMTAGGAKMMSHAANFVKSIVQGSPAAPAVDAGVEYITGERGFHDGDSQSENSHTTVAQTRVIQDVFGSMNYPEPSQVVAAGGLRVAEGSPMSITSYLRKPTLLYYGTYSGNVIKNFEVDPIHYNDSTCVSRLQAMSKFYRLWRGSINYTIVLVSSPMVSMRIAFQLTWNQGIITELEDFSDVPTKVVTVRGTTVTNITVPYLRQVPYSDCNSSSASENDTCRIISQIISTGMSIGDVEPGIQYYVFESAGPDFEFSSERLPQKTYTATEQTNTVSLTPEVRNESKKPSSYFGFLPIGISQARVQDFVQPDWIGESQPGPTFSRDKDTTFNSLTEHWSVRVGPFGSITTPPYYYATDSGVVQEDNKKVSNVDILSSLFLYWKGSTHRKHVFVYTAPPSIGETIGVAMQSYQNDGNANNLKYDLRFGDGIVQIASEKTQVLEYTIPYISNVEWTYCPSTLKFYSPPTSTITERSTEVATPVYTNLTRAADEKCSMIATGSDFRFRCPQPPPFVNRWQEL